MTSDERLLQEAQFVQLIAGMEETMLAELQIGIAIIQRATPEQKSQIVPLFENGMELLEIAQHFGIEIAERGKSA